MAPLPYDITEAMIQCFGKCFWYKDPLKAFLRAEGVSQILVEKYASEPKYPMTSHILSDLAGAERPLSGYWATTRRKRGFSANTPEMEIAAPGFEPGTLGL
jgi:hypothetical protein